MFIEFFEIEKIAEKSPTSRVRGLPGVSKQCQVAFDDLKTRIVPELIRPPGVKLAAPTE